MVLSGVKAFKLLTYCILNKTQTTCVLATSADTEYLLASL